MFLLVLLTLLVGGCVAPDLPQTSTNVPPTTVAEVKPVETPIAVISPMPQPVKLPMPITSTLDDIQKLIKGSRCAAVLLRTTGGTKGEFGPIRRKQVELRPECDGMLLEVQKFVQSNPVVCSLL